jgi:hypothetical protein
MFRLLNGLIVKDRALKLTLVDRHLQLDQVVLLRLLEIERVLLVVLKKLRLARNLVI